MRFTAALALGSLAIVASAQTNTNGNDASSTMSADPYQASLEACIDLCEEGDRSCVARCAPVRVAVLDSVDDR
jgi:hypothetical protein